MGACLRCHNQRAKCEPNEIDPLNRPCKTCENVNKLSRKTIHNFPCVRYKLTGISLFRRGGLGYTTRFTHEKLKDVPGYGDIHTVFMASGLSKSPVRLEIHLFRPKSSDFIFRSYVHDGVAKKVKLAPYCLVDVEKTSNEFVDYVNEHAFDGLLEAVKDEDIVVRETFKVIAKHCDALPENEQKELLRRAVRLWFAIRHGIGTSTFSGARPQGMGPIHDPDNYFRGEVPPMPRMIVAQFDSIRHERLYKIHYPAILKLMEKILTSKNMDAWFTAYLVMFLFLDLVSAASRDRLRWARENSGGMPMESRYGPTGGKMTDFVEELHRSGAVMLMYWHYYKRIDLMKTEWDDPNDQTLKALTPEEIEFMRWTVGDIKERKIPQTPSEGCWEDSMFWISQMLTSSSKSSHSWTPPETFSCQRPSVGRDVNPTV